MTDKCSQGGHDGLVDGFLREAGRSAFAITLSENASSVKDAIQGVSLPDIVEQRDICTALACAKQTDSTHSFLYVIRALPLEDSSLLHFGSRF